MSTVERAKSHEPSPHLNHQTQSQCENDGGNDKPLPFVALPSSYLSRAFNEERIKGTHLLHLSVQKLRTDMAE